VVSLKEKRAIDENFFKAMNYEFAGEIGLIDNEDMKKNKYLNQSLKESKKNQMEQVESRH